MGASGEEPLYLITTDQSYILHGWLQVKKKDNNDSAVQPSWSRRVLRRVPIRVLLSITAASLRQRYLYPNTHVP